MVAEFGELVNRLHRDGALRAEDVADLLNRPAVLPAANHNQQLDRAVAAGGAEMVAEFGELVNRLHRDGALRAEDVADLLNRPAVLPAANHNQQLDDAQPAGPVHLVLENRFPDLPDMLPMVGNAEPPGNAQRRAAHEALGMRRPDEQGLAGWHLAAVVHYALDDADPDDPEEHEPHDAQPELRGGLRHLAPAEIEALKLDWIENVHSYINVKRIGEQLAALAKAYPVTDTRSAKLLFPELERTIGDELSRVVERSPHLNTPTFGSVAVLTLARNGLHYLCEQGRDGRTVIDHESHKVGHVLASAWAMIQAQPTSERRDAAVGALLNGLAHAQGDNEEEGSFCSTRHVGELLQALTSIDQDGTLPPPLPDFSTSRDAITHLSKIVLQQATGGEADFAAQLRTAVAAEHPAIPAQHIDRFMAEFVQPDWDSFQNHYGPQVED